MLLTGLLGLLRALAVAIPGLLATAGPFFLGFAVMTQCTNTTSECTAPQVILIVGWIAQGVLLAVAVSLWLPVVVDWLSRRAIAVTAAVVSFLAVAVFAGTAWVSSNAYCLDTQVQRDYCDAD